jgi:hypothetical protein
MVFFMLLAICFAQPTDDRFDVYGEPGNELRLSTLIFDLEQRDILPSSTPASLEIAEGKH